MSNIWTAFALTLFAGLATGIGSILAFFSSRWNFRFLSFSTGFSAGVMLYVSFVEILFKGKLSLQQVYGTNQGEWINTAAFFMGILLIALIDNFIPATKNPHEVHRSNELLQLSLTADSKDNTLLAKAQKENAPVDHKLLRMGIFTALAIGIHNFPEGMATFLSALQDPALGIAIAIAIALHNIPEGISVSVPIFYATGSRKKAFLFSLLSGMAEPIGAVIGFFLINLFLGSRGFIPPQIMGILFASVAGIMVYISLDELLPTSRAYGKGHDSLIGLVSGMLLMAISLLLI